MRPEFNYFYLYRLVSPLLYCVCAATVLFSLIARAEAEMDLVASERAPRTMKVEVVGINNADQILHREDRVAVIVPSMRSSSGSQREVKNQFALEADRIDGQADWLTYTGYKAFVTGDFGLDSDFKLLTQAGTARLNLLQFQKVNYQTQGDLFLWKVRSTYAPTKSTFAGTVLLLEAMNDFAYVGWLDAQRASHVETARIFFAEASSRTLPGWELRSNAKFFNLSDQNRQQIFDHLVLKDVLEAPLVLRIGAGGGWTEFSDQKPSYWSPAFFESYGLRVVALKRFSEMWELETRLNYGYRRANRENFEKELISDVRLRYRNRDGWLVGVNGNFMDVNNGKWWKSDIGCNLEVPL